MLAWAPDTVQQLPYPNLPYTVSHNGAYHVN